MIDEDTYRIKVGPSVFRKRYESQLCAGEPYICAKHLSLDYTAHEAHWDDDYAQQDNYTVQKTLVQRQIAPAPGGVEFRVRWQGYGPSHDT